MKISPLGLLNYGGISTPKNKFKKLPVQRGLTEIEELLDVVQPYGYIIGGYARYVCSPSFDPIEPGDCDIYCKDSDSYDELAVKLKRWLKIEKETKFSVRYKYGTRLNLTSTRHPNPFKATLPQLNLIKPIIAGKAVLAGTPEDILANFDFTVTRAAILDKTECLVDADFIDDELNKILVLKNIHCPVGTSLRILKYVKKGYHINSFNILPIFLDWEQRTDEYKRDLITTLQQIGIISELSAADDKYKKTAEYRMKLASLPTKIQTSIQNEDKGAINDALGSFYENMALD